MIIRGVELEFSIYNPMHIKKYRSAAVAVDERVVELSEINVAGDIDGYIEVLTGACDTIFSFFDDAFGDGTSNKLFGETVDFVVCMEAFLEIGGEVVNQSESLNRKVEEFAPNTTTRD